MLKTERASLLIPCFFAAPEHNAQCVIVSALFSLLCLGASCSSFGPLTRCESLLLNKWRKGVMLCLCVMLRVHVPGCALFKFVLHNLTRLFSEDFLKRHSGEFFQTFLSLISLIASSSNSRCVMSNRPNTSCVQHSFSAFFFFFFCDAEVKSLISCCY